MKKLILSVSALFLFSGLFAQEKEIDAALTAYESNNVAEAKAALSGVAGQINSNTVSPEAKAKYFYTQGQIALKEGQSIEAAQHFNELAKHEFGSVYSIRNKDSKQTEYYATKAEADAAAASGNYTKPKEEALKSVYMPKIQDQLKTKAENTLKQAMTAVESNRHEVAGDKFLEASYLVEAIGGDAGLFKYNAALSYHKAEAFQKAFDTYKSLIEDGYTGVKTTWVGTNRAKEEVSFSTESEAKLQEKAGEVFNVKEAQTPSVEKDIALYTLGVLTKMKAYDPIVETIATKFSNDNQIQTEIGNVYYFSGKQDLFIDKLKENIKINPNEPINYFNLGVLYNEMNDDANAESMFLKAIQVDPNYKNAYINLALLKIKPEKEYVEIMNSNLGNTDKQKKTYKEYAAKRKVLYVEAVPYFKKAFDLDPKNYEYAKMLRQAYQNAEMFDEEDAMRTIEKTLQ